MTLRGKISSVIHHPSILKYVIQGKSSEEIRAKVISIDGKGLGKEVPKFISHLKRTSPYHINPNDKPKLNKLCHLEDFHNRELRQALSEIQKLNPMGHIHRKDWEWAMGIIAMQRLGKLNKRCSAIGIGSGTEVIPFYLANKINHVYATDLYNAGDWSAAAPSDFPKNPKKYASFPYREDALTIMRMDGTKLEFPSETFDIAFSFSSIEHFGGKNHSGALKSVREMERVLKPGGIAVIATEYIINNKKHYEFFNRRTIYDDLINKLEKLQLVEPLDLRITTKTLDTAMGLFDTVDSTHTHVLVRYGDLLLTSVMLVFQKQ